MSLDAPRRYSLDPRVALREEPFGALAYHYGNRRLSFLRSPELVEVLRALGSHESIDAALDAAGVATARRPSFRRALATLEASSMVREQAASHPEEAGPLHLAPQPPSTTTKSLTGDMKRGLDAPICLTWEITYGCNLACIHCLSSSGRRDPRELSTAEAQQVIDDLQAMQVFYVNIGGGEPTIRPDFFDLVDYSVAHGVGVKFSTNGTTMTRERAERIAGTDYVDVQISIDGANATTNDAVRGGGSFDAALNAMELLANAGFGEFKISVVVTRHNVAELDDLASLAERFGAQLRLTRLRPSGRGADTWNELHPTQEQQLLLYRWLRDRPNVLTGDSFFHLSALGEPLPGLNLCGAGRVVCLIDPVGDVYACPFVLHDEFKAGSVRDHGGFAKVWRESERFASLREPGSAGACASCGSYDACQGGCMAAKFFTGLPLDGPDPECVKGYGEQMLASVAAGSAPSPGPGHSKPVRAVPVALGATRRS
ncbi:MAG: mycofactocin radical SAM maturase [Acidimicrobiia bacterium]